MKLRIFEGNWSVCKLDTPDGVHWEHPCFFARTADELSLVCRTEDVPAVTSAREDGWRALQVEGPLDFGLVGILARLTGALAEAGIPVFAVSTFDTDYLLVKEDRFADACAALREWL